jgi:hypothetical protein
MNTGKLVALAVIGYLIWREFSQSDLAGAIGTTGTTGAGAGTGPGTNPSSPGAGTSTAPLTAADAAVYPYSTAVTAAQINAINAQLVSALQAGQIPVIAENSVLNYMLGWGVGASGATKSLYGYAYVSDGANWHMQAAAPAAASVPTTAGTPAAGGAGFTITGTVTNLGPTFQNALKATVQSAYGVVNIAVIPGGGAYNDAGQEITAQLAPFGITPAALYQAMHNKLAGLSGYARGLNALAERMITLHPNSGRWTM